MEEVTIRLDDVDILENELREKLPAVLDILLCDRTTKKNIIWGNDNYKRYGYKAYGPKAEMKSILITGHKGGLIKPRALKNNSIKHSRKKQNAEVFTPVWVIKEQNDSVDALYKADDFETYINREWLEITCGEGPYMTTRYDMIDGQFIELDNREGFVDRKFKRLNSEIHDIEKWNQYAKIIYKSSYGFEWNGDSLLLARENLLYTFIDNYKAKWGSMPSVDNLMNIAEIISYNVFQMDGMKFIIPLSEEKKLISVQSKLDIFGDYLDTVEEENWLETKGIKVKIKNWKNNKMELFEEVVNRE